MPTLRPITSPSGATTQWPEGTRIGDILEAVCPASGAIAALLENDLVSLAEPLDFGGAIRPVLPSEEYGRRILERTACFLLAMAAHNALPTARLRIHNAAGTSLICTLDSASLEGGGAQAPEGVALLSSSLAAIVAADHPITSLRAPYLLALKGFEAYHREDKANLLRHRSDPAVRLSECDGFYDLWHGPLAPSTGSLKGLSLSPFPGGFLLNLPIGSASLPLTSLDAQAPSCASTIQPSGRPEYAAIARAQEHIRWGSILGIRTVGDLNAAIAEGRANEVVQMVEALHDQRLADIASTIATRATPVRLVLLAGPSSAGKTTTARRLATHLRVRGLRPILLGTDDYFRLPADTPLDPETGTPDFEHLEALDLPALNADLNALLSGAPVPRRTYDFLAQKPVHPGDTLTLPPDGILLIEGLHALNPHLTDLVPDGLKFRLFLNAMTPLGLDETNRISTTDNRLLRRMLRDRRTRGKSPLMTLRSWPQVRRGEERWIFPFQPLADEVFNTALDYELAVLRPLAEPLLTTVKPDVPEYADARRLLRLLANFHALGAARVPNDSILRETLGESLFE